MNEFKKATREIKASMDIDDDLKEVKHSFDELSADIKGKRQETDKAVAKPEAEAAAPDKTATQESSPETPKPPEAEATASSPAEPTHNE